MKETTKKILRNPLISGSTIIFVGSFLSNIFNYIFNLSMGRMLSVSDYGLYFTLTSILGLFSVLTVMLQSLFAKFSAQYSARNDVISVRALMSSGFKITFIIGLISVIVLFLMTSFFSSFLNITDIRLLFLIFSVILISILFSMPLGILQGAMRFYFVSFITPLITLLKIITGVGLVLMGFKVFGVLFSILISFLIPYFICIFYMGKIYKNKDNKEVDMASLMKEIKGYSMKYLLASFGMVFISNVDIILVRHFFDSTTSGQYAALSLMGRAIFYLTAPIYFVFFPLIAQKKERKEKLFSTLLMAGAIITLFSAGLSFVYFLFPDLILKIFFPSKEYLILSQFLGPFSLYILVFSVASLFNNFFLSTGKLGIYKINILMSLLFLLLIYIFHDTLYQIIGTLFFISFLLLASFLIYYKYNERD